VIMKNNILYTGSVALLLLIFFCLTAPQNHTEAEDVYDFALRVEQGTFADQVGVNRLLALPLFGWSYQGAQWLGYTGRAFPWMILINRALAVGVICLFYRILVTSRLGRSGLWDGSSSTQPSSASEGASSTKEEAAHASPAPVLSPLSGLDRALLPTLFCFMFSYGFWRYANEAESYILAAFFVVLAWHLVFQKRWIWCAVISALGVLIHLLNLIPLLMIIPLFYLFIGEWKKGILHGLIASLLVLTGYGLCFQLVDWQALGEQHHLEEAGISVANLLRGAVAFGQSVVGANFLFGFQWVRGLLVELFPSRMLGEEFFMAAQMASWVKWVASVTLGMLGGLGIWVLLHAIRLFSRSAGRMKVWRFNGFAPFAPSVAWRLACLLWILLYSAAVIRTEAGSPELWILVLIPFWLVMQPLLVGRRAAWLAAALFLHNLIGGLLPVMSVESDYHVAKGRWILEHSGEDDLILTSYEPIMIFYLTYFAEAQVINSGACREDALHHYLGSCRGNVYALNSFFEPLPSMRVRSPEAFARMEEIGQAFRPGFVRIVEDEFGGIFKWAKAGGCDG
jgi:hypothetical protein